MPSPPTPPTVDPPFTRETAIGTQGNYADPTATPALYIDAFQHVVNVLRAEVGSSKFEFDINQYDGLNKTTPLKDFYPGDSYVDMNVITTYNRDGIGQIRHDLGDLPRQLYGFLHPGQGHVVAPIGIAEMSEHLLEAARRSGSPMRCGDRQHRLQARRRGDLSTRTRPSTASYGIGAEHPAEIAAFQAGVAQLRSEAVARTALSMSSF